MADIPTNDSRFTMHNSVRLDNLNSKAESKCKSLKHHELLPVDQACRCHLPTFKQQMCEDGGHDGLHVLYATSLVSDQILGIYITASLPC